jgi:hypothetical protein
MYIVELKVRKYTREENLKPITNYIMHKQLK